MDFREFERFMLAGKATFTLHSERTGEHRTFRVRRSERGLAQYFVDLLTGPDNEQDFSYLGVLRGDGVSGLKFFTTKASCADSSSPSARGFDWLINHLNWGTEPLPGATVHHAGHCGRCGRTLTHPASLESGLGPECVKRVSGP